MAVQSLTLDSSLARLDAKIVLYKVLLLAHYFS
jgi:hypothetical protein